MLEDCVAKMLEGCVTTNGCFDILHVGHLDLLQYCKKVADDLNTQLVICVNSDNSVRKLKGENRPLNNLADRCRMLRALNLGLVFPFEEDSPYEIFKKIKPTVIIKGSDYKPEEVIGYDLAKILIFPKLEGFSSSNYIK